MTTKDTLITIPEPDTRVGITLTPEAREKLLDTCLVGDSSDSGGMSEDDWRRLEDALSEIFLPRRWILGVDKAPPSRPAADTPANEGHLTPKPLEEQVPGAWNFIEPPPAHMGAGWQRATQPQPPADGATAVRSSGQPIDLLGSLQVVIDSHPERQQQALAEEIRRNTRNRHRSVTW